MRFSHFILFFFLFAAALPGKNWYVRADGGTATQCTGIVDAPYAGTGSAQPCGFKNPFYLWTNDPPQSKAYETPVWKIAGGDTVIIANGDYKMGFKTPDANGWWNYLGCRGNNHACYNPPIPPGTNDAPTRIVGEGWQTGCSVKPVLRGGGAVFTVLNLMGTNHVDVECLEFSDNAQCRLQTLPTEPYPCVIYQTDHAYWALQTDVNTSYLTLRNLFIHGMAADGIVGAVGGNVLADNVHLRANGNLGWNFDYNSVSSKGPLTISKVLIEWSACVERYPLADPVILACYDQAGANANGDGLGFIDLDGDIFIDRSIIRYNQQDGLDALYVKSGKTLSVTNSQFYGNNGQQIKTGGAANMIIHNNLIIGNCNRQRAPVDGVTEVNYNVLEKDFCRASDMAALIFKNQSSLSFENNSIVTYHPTAFDVQCTAINDIITSAGRVSTDGTVDPTVVPNGSVKTFTLAYPIQNITTTGAIYVYPKTGTRVAKRVGQVGVDQTCAGAPCQYWYTPGSNALTQDPSEPPVPADSELWVVYSNPSLCANNQVSLSFANNLIRGYQSLNSTEMAGSFWFNNLLPGSPISDPRTRLNNTYCGIKGFTAGPTEHYSAVCPGKYFANEPAVLTSEVQLDSLDPHLTRSSPGLDAGTTLTDVTTDFEGVSRPFGPAYDLGAFELAPVSKAPDSPSATVKGNGIRLKFATVPGASFYEIQRSTPPTTTYTSLGRVHPAPGSLDTIEFTDTGADVHGASCYQIRGGNDFGTSDWSAPACIGRTQVRGRREIPQ